MGSMSDLTDHDLAVLTQEIKSSHSANQPLIGSLDSIVTLARQYEQSPTYASKIDNLRTLGYASIRSTRGDGDCWYRSQSGLALALFCPYSLRLHCLPGFAFAYCERLITTTDPRKAQHSIAKLESLLPLLDQVGFARDMQVDPPLAVVLVTLIR